MFSRLRRSPVIAQSRDPDASVVLREVATRKDLRDFVRFPFVLHAQRPLWVPPLLRDEYAFFDADKNPAFRTHHVCRFVAELDGRMCGRIMGIIRKEPLRNADRGGARFSSLESIADLTVVKSLMSIVERWAIGLGADRLVGPLGFTDQDPEGFLIEGFDLEPTIATYYNMPFIPGHLEQCGYEKEVDYVVYLVDLTRPVPGVFLNIADRAERLSGVRYHHFTSKRQLSPYVVPILTLMNESFEELYGYQMLSPDEIRSLARQFMPVIDPRFVKAATVEGRAVGFLIAMPNMNEGLRKAAGSLFPIGFLHILSSARRSRQLDFLIGGTSREYRKKGLEVWGITRMIQEAQRAGFTVMDSHHELETNVLVRSEMERLGGRLRKRFRVYRKVLGS